MCNNELLIQNFKFYVQNLMNYDEGKRVSFYYMEYFCATEC
jgi:hypothetical protein